MKRKLNGLLSLWLAAIMILSSVAVFAEGETTGSFYVYLGNENIEGVTTLETKKDVEFNKPFDEQNLLGGSNDNLLGWNIWGTVGSGGEFCNVGEMLKQVDKSYQITADEYSSLVSVDGYAPTLDPVYKTDNFTLYAYKGEDEITVGADYDALNYVAVEKYDFFEQLSTQVRGIFDISVMKDLNCKLWKVDDGKYVDYIELSDSDFLTYSEFLEGYIYVEPDTKEKVTISFDANGGEGEMKDVTVAKGSEYEIPECEFEAPEGKAFSGWKMTTEKVSTPEISFVYNEESDDITITITCSTKDTTIYYSIDNNSFVPYTGPFTSKHCYIKAYATKKGSITSSTTSLVTAEQVKKPYISTKGSISSNGIEITITCSTEDSTIYYIIDDAVAIQYTEPFTINEPCTIKAYATKRGYRDSSMYTITITEGGITRPTSGGGSGGSGGGGGSHSGSGSSDIPDVYPGESISFDYNTILTAIWYTPSQVATPEFSPDGGTFRTSALDVKISCDTPRVTIYYTTNSEDPRDSSKRKKYEGNVYIKADTTIKAYAVKDGMEDSEVATAFFDKRATSGGSSSSGSGSSYGGSTSIKTYTIKFNTKGGLTVPDQYISRNKTVKEPEKVTKYGYTFEGWYTDEKYTTKYDFDTPVTKSFTLYAKWSEGESSGNSSGGTLDNRIILTIGQYKMLVFGKEVIMDVVPQIVNDRTMLPARHVAEALGATVEWNESEPKKVRITKDNTEIILWIDSDTAYLNGEAVTLDSPAFLENDRTYTPVRFICENLGATVDWEEGEQKVIILADR